MNLTYATSDTGNHCLTTNIVSESNNSNKKKTTRFQGFLYFSVPSNTRQTRSACTSPMPGVYPERVECGTSPLKSQPADRASERQSYRKANGVKAGGSGYGYTGNDRLLNNYR